MIEMHAKTIVAEKFWFVEQDGKKVATLHKQENNRFILTNRDGDIWFNKKEEITNYFGKDFFLNDENSKIAFLDPSKYHECHGFPTKTQPYNAMFDVQRSLPLFTKSSHSKSFHCAGWYVIKFKNFTISYCPKLITIERYEYLGPFKTRIEASEHTCLAIK